MPVRPRPTPLLLLALAAAAPAAAQPWSNMPEPLRRADPGISDINPLRLSLRELQVDLRQPTGFDTVYRADTAPHLGAGGRMYMRMDGGITAIFPQSVYQDSPQGPIAQIPAGTTFILGALPPDLTAQPARPRPPGYLDLSIDQRAHTTTQNEPPTDTPHERSIWTDDEYRRYRIERLLSRAAP